MDRKGFLAKFAAIPAALVVADRAEAEELVHTKIQRLGPNDRVIVREAAHICLRDVPKGSNVWIGGMKGPGDLTELWTLENGKHERYDALVLAEYGRFVVRCRKRGFLPYEAHLPANGGCVHVFAAPDPIYSSGRLTEREAHKLKIAYSSLLPGAYKR